MTVCCCHGNQFVKSRSPVQNEGNQQLCQKSKLLPFLNYPFRLEFSVKINGIIVV